MSADVYESCRKILNFAPPELVNAYSEKMLRLAIVTHIGESGRDDIANVAFGANGKEYPNIFEAISEISDAKELVLIISDFKPDVSWTFSVPTTKIKVLTNGVGWLHLRDKPAASEEGSGTKEPEPPLSPDHPPLPQVIPPDTPPTPQAAPPGPDAPQACSKQNLKAMFRIYATSHFKPQLLKPGQDDDDIGMDVPFGIVRFEQLWSGVRKEGIVPLTVKLCAYTQTSRLLYHIDLLRGKLLRDVREDNIPQVNHLKRTGLDFFQLDRVLSMSEVPWLSKKILEIIFESKEIDSPELAHIFHSQENRIDQFVDVLVRRGYVTIAGRPPNEKFVANMDAIKNAPD
jgi:hypothetical protein